MTGNQRSVQLLEAAPRAVRMALAALVGLSMSSLMGCSVTMEMAHAKASARSSAAAADKGPVYLPDSTINDADGARAPAVAQAAVDAPASISAGRRAPVINVFGEVRGGVVAAAAPRVSESVVRQQTFTDVGYDGDISLDATGKWMVFTSTRNSEHQDIYLQRADAASVTQLTADAFDNCQPSFSPDGKHVAFSSDRDGCWHLYVMDADGRNVTQMTEGTSQDIHPSFSPDGQRLVYSSIASTAGAQWELCTLNVTTLAKKSIGHGLFPVWCPASSVSKTGRTERIAFQKARARGSRWFSLWTLDLVDGEPRNLTEVAVSINAAIVTPCWSPDGQRLAFATIVDPAKTTDGKPKGQQDVWTVNVDGTARHRLTDGTGVNLQPFWAADNRVYFVSDRSGHECVWSIAAPAGTATASPSVASTAAQGPGVKAAAPEKVKPVPGQDAVGANEPREVAP